MVELLRLSYGALSTARLKEVQKSYYEECYLTVLDIGRDSFLVQKSSNDDLSGDNDYVHSSAGNSAGNSAENYVRKGKFVENSDGNVASTLDESLADSFACRPLGGSV